MKKVYTILIIFSSVIFLQGEKIELSKVGALEKVQKVELYRELVNGMGDYTPDEYVELVARGLDDSDVSEFALAALFWSSGYQVKHGSQDKKLNYSSIDGLKEKLSELAGSSNMEVAGMSAASLAYIFPGDREVEGLFVLGFNNAQDAKKKVGYLRLLIDGKYNSQAVESVMLSATASDDSKIKAYGTKLKESLVAANGITQISPERAEASVRHSEDDAQNGVLIREAPTATEEPKQAEQVDEPTTEDSNTVLYLLIGAILIGGLFFVFNRKAGGMIGGHR